jgi:transcriptional regulator with XRE-family HTH domain
VAGQAEAGQAEAGFGAVLRELRARRRLSQEALAVRAAVSARTVSDLERGIARAPHWDTVSRLARGLELDDADRERLAAAARGQPGPAAAAAAPAAAAATLPCDTAAFTGRDGELGQITAAVAEAAAGGGVVAIRAIGGMPGAGKTTPGAECIRFAPLHHLMSGI